jgi:hypothetical protein
MDIQKKGTVIVHLLNQLLLPLSASDSSLFERVRRNTKFGMCLHKILLKKYNFNVQQKSDFFGYSKILFFF